MFKVSYFSLLNNKAQSKLVIIMYELDQMVCHFSIISSPQMCSKIFTVITQQNFLDVIEFRCRKPDSHTILTVFGVFLCSLASLKDRKKLMKASALKCPAILSELQNLVCLSPIWHFYNRRNFNILAMLLSFTSIRSLNYEEWLGVCKSAFFMSILCSNGLLPTLNQWTCQK